MIETYKLLSGKNDDQASLQLKSKMSSLPSDYKTRGHSRKLEVRRCRYDLRKYSFSNRITNMWNSLPDSVVMADRPTVKLTNLKMGLISTGLNMHFCMTIVLTIMEPEACLLYRKIVKI